jgi:nucleoside-diphosphate-sugar epimerase
MKSTTLILGASGQIGIELTMTLRKKLGNEQVIASDIRPTTEPELLNGPYEILDVLDKPALEAIIERYQVGEVYLLAALLSATAEKNPEFAWRLNMEGLFNVLELAKAQKISKVFWPSSIAVFGPTTPRHSTPQHTTMEPTTVYGISKLAGERWCAYYHERYGVDVRSIRYPGLIGYRSEPGGGTTDYAVAIFHQAIEHGTYACFLKEDTELPMMMMEDAIRATIGIMEAPSETIRERGGYNIAGCSFTPAQVATIIQRSIPDFNITYAPDFRQAIADSWPASIDDSAARTDWGWQQQYDTEKLCAVMLSEIRKKKAASVETPA